MHMSSGARGLGQMYARLLGHSVYACMSCGVFDAGCCCVALHVLQKCSLLQQSCPTVWLRVGRSDAQTMCWVPLKAHVVDRMPCTCILMQYCAQNKCWKVECWTLKSAWNVEIKCWKLSRVLSWSGSSIGKFSLSEHAKGSWLPAT